MSDEPPVDTNAVEPVDEPASAEQQPAEAAEAGVPEQGSDPVVSDSAADVEAKDTSLPEGGDTKEEGQKSENVEQPTDAQAAGEPAPAQEENSDQPAGVETTENTIEAVIESSVPAASDPTEEKTTPAVQEAEPTNDASPRARKRSGSIVSCVDDNEIKRVKLASGALNSSDASFIMCRERSGFVDPSARKWFCSESRTVRGMLTEDEDKDVSAKTAKFWLAFRAGRMPLSSLPRFLFNDLYGFMEARNFIDQHRDVDSFWELVNANQVQAGQIPVKLEHAIDAARKQGAKHFFCSGTYAAPSEHLSAAGIEQLGLYSLCMRLPNEMVANWSGSWLWKDHDNSSEVDRFFPVTDDGDEENEQQESKTIDQFENASVLKDYALLFRPPEIKTDTDEDKKYQVALVDPSRGATEVRVEDLAEEEECCCLMNEPRPGHMANCMSISTIFTTETKVHRRYQLVIVTGVPVLAGEELLMHYGTGYERDYPVGEPCTQMFEAMPVRSTFADK